ncbi:MAG: right-handed parallel beta-helix repeat-containing protein [Nitrospirota bacterium]
MKKQAKAKGIFTFLLYIFLILGLITCGSGGGTDNSGGTTNNSNNTPPPPPPPSGKNIYVDVLINSASCTTYSVSTRSCGQGAETAYKDLNAASGAASPGDTVLIRQATFTSRFIPQKSGTSSSPITFKNYPNETVVITITTGNPSVGLELTDRQYLVIDGINVEDTWMWAQILRSHHNIFKNSRFSIARDYGSRGDFRLVDSNYNKIINNTFEDGNDNLFLENSNRNLVEGNSFKKARHTLLVIACGNYNVMRGNTFYNELQKAIETFDCEGVIESLYDDTLQVRRLDAAKRNIWEGNRFTYTRASNNWWDYQAMQFAGQQGIVRRNMLYNNQGGGIAINYYADEALYVYGNRVYHNTMYNNSCFGLWGSNGDSNYYDNIAKNNIAYSNLNCTGTAGADMINNNSTKNLFLNNRTDNPLFADAASYNLNLSSGSPMINAGIFLTSAVGSGSGAALQVSDAGYFYDGYGIERETGDEIQLEGQTETAIVLAVDYNNNTLTLNKTLSWSAGQGVALKYNGAAPDVGAYEAQ